MDIKVDLGKREKVVVTSSLRIIVTGLIAHHRWLGGVTWDYLNVLLGFVRLGHDVYYLEDSGQWPYTFEGSVGSDESWVAYDCTGHVKYLAEVMAQFGLEDRWAYRFPITPKWFGMSEAKRKAVFESADLLLDVSGTLEHPEHYRQVRRLAYMDTDPVFTQIALAQGQTERVDQYDIHFSVGECIGQTGPETGHAWRPMKHPIALSEWQSCATQRDVLTTIMNWTSYKPLTYQGQIYAQKDVEFMKFLQLPSQVNPVTLEVALPKLHHIHWQTACEEASPAVVALLTEKSHWTPHELLTHMGWQVVDALAACADFRRYHAYITSSKGEWSVAKNGYVRGASGWFSGRSACYLAAGRPVVVQDTGFSQVLPVGEGVLAFTTMEEAIAAVQDVEGNYDRHAKAAGEIADAYFNSNTILTRLIEEALAETSTTNG